MATTLVPVDESALDNPGKADIAEEAGQVLVLGFVAAGTFYAANEVTKSAIKAVSNGKTGAELVKAQKDTLTMHGAVKVAGGAAVGIAGRYGFDGGWAGAITDGIAAGLIVSGSMDLKGAYELSQPPTVVVTVPTGSGPTTYSGGYYGR